MRTMADGRTIPDAMSLDWSDLVHVATKAIESKQTDTWLRSEVLVTKEV